MLFKKKDKIKKRFIPLSDIEELDSAFINEIERVHARLAAMADDKDVIKAFYDVLTSAYNGAIEIKTLEREVEYDIKRAEIEARRRELKPWRRWWIWKLFFQPLTNRAQDIIEERAEVDADIIHTAAEEAIDKESEKLPTDDKTKLSKRELKRIMQDKLNEVIQKADNADMKEAFNEPPEPVQVNTEKPAHELAQDKKQLPGQIMLEDVLKLPPAAVHRARPPRSCRKQ